MKVNDTFLIDITDMGTEGEGIGRAEGAAVFIPGAVPGDKVLAEITQVKKNYARARVAELRQPSPMRVEPECPHAGVCGGCSLAGVKYEGQLALKKKWVEDRLRRIGGVGLPEIGDVIGMEPGEVASFMQEMPAEVGAEPDRRLLTPAGYRNKAQFPVRAGRLVKNREGKYRNDRPCSVGFYKARSHEVVHCDSCLIQTAPAVAVAGAVKRYVEENTVSVYDEKNHMGLLRHVVVRSAFATGEVMVVLVVNGDHLPRIERLVELLDDAVYESNFNGNLDMAGTRPAAAGMEAGCSDQSAAEGKEDGDNRRAEAGEGWKTEAGCEEAEPFWSLESVVINVNKAKGAVVMGKECIPVAGKSTITDRLGSLQFEISPLSFYQVNPVQMKKLYDKVVEFAALTGEETVLDLYCGVGTIGLYCAGNARRVIGIESVKPAVLDANRNAVINGIVNAEFICGKAEEILPKRLSGINADVVIMDPPRSGCDPALLEAVLRVAPERIVYVSCDPATLARDLKVLCAGGAAAEQECGGAGSQRSDGGYRVVRVQPVDMFPGTGHIETAVLLVRKQEKY